MSKQTETNQKTFAPMLVVALLAVALLTACGEAHDIGHTEPETETRQQAVKVVPEFSVAGTDKLPDKLFISNVGLTVSEIRLEPLTYGHNGIVYASRTPADLSFEVGNDETSKIGDTMELPAAGRYLVSVRVEAVDTKNGGAANDGSLRIAGYAAGKGIDRNDPRRDGSVSDGSPVPLPPDDEKPTEDGDEQLDDVDERPVSWTPFHYESHRSVHYPIGSVKLESGTQKLNFTFNVRDWALKLVEPVLQAVGDVDSPSRDSAVDVTREVDNRGEGPESFMKNASVQIK